MNNFVCVCYGDKYPVEYVQKLYNMVKRNLTKEFKFTVFTDHVKMHKMVSEEINVVKFPLFDLEGWWNKMQLFHPDVDLPDTTLYMDLDVVITSSIDCFFEHEPGNHFMGMNDFNPVTGLWNSSIMRFQHKPVSNHMWENFVKGRSEFLKRYPGDQNLISHLIKDNPGKLSVSSFPDSWTQSYKWYDRKGRRYSAQDWTFEHNGESLVTVFHGQPNPHESDKKWVKNAWK